MSIKYFSYGIPTLPILKFNPKEMGECQCKLFILVNIGFLHFGMKASQITKKNKSSKVGKMRS